MLIQLLIFLVYYFLGMAFVYKMTNGLKKQRAMIICYYSLYSMMIICNYYFHIFDSFLLDPDFFSKRSNELLEIIINPNVSIFEELSKLNAANIGANLYMIIIIIPLMCLTFNYPPSIILILFVLFVFAVIKLIELHRDRLSDKGINILLLLLFMYPALFLHNMVLMRESIGVSVTILLIYSLLNLTKSIKYKIGFLISLFLLTMIRSQNFPVVIVLLIIYIFLFQGIRKNKILFSLLVIGIILALETEYGYYLGNIDVRYISNYRIGNANLPQAYLTNINLSSWWDVIKYFPMLLFYYVFSPFPWQIENFRFLFNTTDSLYITIISLLFIKYTLNAKLDKRDYFIFIFVFIFLGSYSLLEVYHGGAVRHRMPQIILLIPYAAMSFKKASMNREK
ncbi:hypothetical protein [Bacillus sp. RIT 809]|uniref:hypothetical protein n=1 Tax=Bacillus sp. RIT 809 TaxID=2803857 RepID=UPI00194DE916|nr:hypothetical protein [Bacillus sp. RIT 809]MBM6648155.1 hypothetical protein [Bacillus sp. RIT 809]